MNLNKVIIVIAFVTSILIISSSQISFAKKNDKEEDNGEDLKKDIPVSQITFSRRKLRSIIYNLVSNSIKYRSPDRKPEILVSTKEEKGFFIISVKDNGMGIAPGNLEAIFSKYFRVQNDIEGSGVGLYLVNEIVKNAGGKITVESEPGKGTTFFVYLKL